VRLFPSRLHELADAYVLDALDDSDRERFERHLRRCPACAQDVRVMAEAATALAMAVAAEPPPGLRERVLAGIAVTRQLPPEVAEPRRPFSVPRTSRATPATRSPWIPRLATAAAVAGVAAAVTLGLAQNSTQHRLDNAQVQSQQIAAVLTAPDAQIRSAATTVGGRATVVLSYSERKIVFTSSGLPALPSSEVYELWLLGPAQARPAGLLPEASDGKTSPVLASGLETNDKVGVTVEPAGGTSSPTTTPILVMTLPNY
jgi:anti-sigma-K factor RskA